MSLVLILIVVDNGLVLHLLLWLLTLLMVLILIVVDNGLVHTSFLRNSDGTLCLNPYCSGQWSRTYIPGEKVTLTNES